MGHPTSESRIVVERTGPEGLKSLADLQKRYPYKTFQRRAQGLDQNRLLAFYASGLARAAESGTPTWVAKDGSETVGAAQLSPDPWHSEVFDLAMGKIGLWLNYRETQRAGLELLRAVREEARAQGIEHLSVRIDGGDYANLRVFESEGFNLVDLSLKLSRPFREDDPEFASKGGSALRDGWKIREATQEDKDWIGELAATHHTRNHFFNDPALDREKAHRLFGLWCERCIEGLAYRIYALEDASGRGKGFVIYLRNRGFAEAVGRNPLILDFVILDPSIRGRGLGPALVGRSLAACAQKSENEAEKAFDYCELRTSHDNLPAIAMYENLGFRVCAGDFILHGGA